MFSNKLNLVVSPSGNLYGSEYVLLDFLKFSKKKYQIYVPIGSKLHIKLSNEDYNVVGFSSLKLLYFKVFFKMIFSSKSLFLNEAGHISYLKTLARFLPFNKFVICVRLLEDCNNKLKNISKNISVVAVSNYIKTKINPNLNPIVIYDPYSLNSTIKKKININFSQKRLVKIGIIGRVIKTKGIENLIDILDKMNEIDTKRISFHFFGNYDINDHWFINFRDKLQNIKHANVCFEGYVTNQSIMYNSLDFIIHLNKVEALGRVLFEAIDHDTPFLVYNEGGTGELSEKLGCSEMSIQNNVDFVNKISFVINQEKSYFDKKNHKAKNIIKKDFNPIMYSKNIEKYL